MPGAQIDELMHIWAAQSGKAPFADKKHLDDTIDNTVVGDAPWESFSVNYSGPLPPGETPPWMTADYDVWHRNPRTVMRNQLANPDFNDEIHYAPFQAFGKDGKREWKDLMSGNWAFKQAVRPSCFLC